MVSTTVFTEILRLVSDAAFTQQPS